MDKWMILYEGGKNVLPITSVLEIKIQSGGGVVSEPIEKGSFATYNKTNSPLEFTVDLGFEGTNDKLMSVLDKLKVLKEETEVFSLVTPYKAFENLTLKSFDTKFERNGGLGSLNVSCSIVEVKEIGEDDKAKNPSDQSVVNTGLISPKAPSPKQGNEVEKARRAAIAKSIRSRF